jgi:predicted nucleotidyltransferase
VKPTTTEILDFAKSKCPHEILLVAKLGSEAYGIQTEDSDLDILVVYAHNLRTKLDFRRKDLGSLPSIKDKERKLDLRLMEVSSYFKLLYEGACIATESMFSRAEDKLFMNDSLQEIVHHKSDFLTHRMVHTNRGVSRAFFHEYMYADTGEDRKKVLKYLANAMRLLYVIQALKTKGEYFVFVESPELRELLVDMKKGKVEDTAAYDKYCDEARKTNDIPEPSEKLKNESNHQLLNDILLDTYVV